MKLLDFLSEKKMGAATMADTEKRMGGVATVGFEFEFIVDDESEMYATPNRDARTIAVKICKAYLRHYRDLLRIMVKFGVV